MPTSRACVRQTTGPRNDPQAIIAL